MQDCLNSWTEFSSLDLDFVYILDNEFGLYIADIYQEFCGSYLMVTSYNEKIRKDVILTWDFHIHDNVDDFVDSIYQLLKELKQ